MAKAKKVYKKKASHFLANHFAVPDALKVANGGTNKPFKSGKSRGRPKGSSTKPGEVVYNVTGSKSRPAKK